jgi:alpha-L-rhamnosidase
MRILEKICPLVGCDADAANFAARRAVAEAAVTRDFAPFPVEYGGSAFAIWCGLAGQELADATAAYYDTLGHFDTGFLCTEILCGLLLENGAEDVAYTLLTSHDPGSFGYMMDHGATTLWERWDGAASHDHPMFGASAGHLIFSLLGIGQKESSAGYKELVIAPKTPTGLDFAKGSVTLPIGEVYVEWQRIGLNTCFTIRLPENQKCDFIYRDRCISLFGGECSFTC